MNLVCPGCGTTNRVSEDRLHDCPVCGTCHAPLITAKPFSLGDSTLPFLIYDR